MTTLTHVGLALLAACGEERNVEETARIEPYLAVEGEEADPTAVKVERSDSRISLTFTAPKEARYSFGVSVEAPRVAPLAPGMPGHTAASLSQPVVLRYPYDWTWRNQGNVLSSDDRLVMPGVKAGERLYVADTYELFSVRIERADANRARALLLKHRIYNDGGDSADANWPMQRGETAKMEILLFNGLESANRARFGAAPPMRGRMTQAAYRGWTGAAFRAPEYKQIASRGRTAINTWSGARCSLPEPDTRSCVTARETLADDRPRLRLT